MARSKPLPTMPGDLISRCKQSGLFFKVVVLLDVGGTMFEHAALATNLFCAAKSEFRNMEFYYF